MTRAESIAQAVVALLTGTDMTSCPADQVYRDPVRAVDRALLVAVVVELGDEQEPDRTFTQDDHTLELRVTALVKGDDAAETADEIHEESHGRIMAAAPTLGDLAYDVQQGPVTRARDVLEKPVHSITKTYFIKYLTTCGSLS